MYVVPFMRYLASKNGVTLNIDDIRFSVTRPL